MKHILFVRHGKAEEQGLKKDFDRELIEKGRSHVAKAALQVKDKNIKVRLMISSSGLRALQTATIFAETFHYPLKKIEERKELYLADTSTILKCINQIDDNIDTVFMFGHNPGISDIICYLSAEENISLRTSEAVMIRFDTAHWSEIAYGTGSPLFFINR